MFAFYLILQLSVSSIVKRPTDESGYTPKDPIKDEETNVDITKCSFSNFGDLSSDGGAILITKTKVNCSVNDCQFNQCTGRNGGAIYAYYSGENNYEFIIKNSVFTDCNVKTNGGAIYIRSAQPKFHVFTITGCTFTANKAKLGGALFAELRDQLSLENNNFNNNEASTKGASAYLKLGHENIKNSVEEHDTFKIHNNVFIFNPSATNSVNVYVENDKIIDETDPAHANVLFGGCTFNIEQSPAAVENYLHLEVVENEGLFESFKFDSCNCVHQEQKTVSIAPNLEFTNFNFGCTSIDTCENNVKPPTPTPTPDENGYTPTDPIREVSLSINIEKCIFSNHDNLNQNGGAILITFNKKVQCTINDCKFIQCKANIGGAISASYSSTTNYQFSLTNSVFTECEAKTIGGAIYLQSGQPEHHKFIISGCTFNSNKAVNGGGLYAELRDQLNIENCNFNNNEATEKGASAYFKLGHENIKNSVEEHDTFKIHNNVFIFNPSATNSVNVYVENDKITDETDPAHANVLFGGCTFNVGSSRIARSEYLHLEIVENTGGFESFTFDSCNCVHQDQSTVVVPSTIRLYNFNFGCTAIESCKSDQPVELPTDPPVIDDDGYVSHQPIRLTEINIDVKKSLFNKLENKNDDGGAILITTKKKVNCKVDDCKFTECNANNGGSIYAYYSSAVNYEFSVTNSVFTGCVAKTRGGAIYIQSAQPNYHKFDIVKCSFGNNKASYGGGLFAELRDQLNIENCNFNNNEASTKGASAYLKLGHENIKNSVEEHDTFKIHNNVFIFNPSATNSVNVYVENDKITDETDPAHVNVYLGGCTFDVGSSRIARSEYLHLEIVENTGGFESFTFDSCNCVHQDQSTVKILPNLNLNNFNFGCTSIDKCTVNVEKPEISSIQSSIDSSIQSSVDSSIQSSVDSSIQSSIDTSLVDKGIENNSNKNNKSKIGLTVGIAVAAVVVVVAIVIVVVIFILRKKSYGKFVDDMKTDEIADNISGGNSSQFKDQDGAL